MSSPMTVSLRVLYFIVRLSCATVYLDMNKLLGLRAIAHTDALTGDVTFESDVTTQLVADGEGVLDSEFGVTTFT